MSSRIFARLALAASLLLAGCGGHLKKTEIFAAYADDGAPMYYRITLEACGYNGDLQYRAGWFDAGAVDDLFGDLAARASIQNDIVKKHKEAVVKTLGIYMDTLQKADAKPEEITRAKAAFDSALSAVTGVTPAGAPRTSAIDYAGKKFVIILSNNPAEIVAAVKGQVQKRQLLDAVGAALSAKTELTLEGSLQDQMLQHKLDALGQSVQATETQLAGKTNAEVRALLSKIEEEAEALK